MPRADCSCCHEAVLKGFLRLLMLLATGVVSITRQTHPEYQHVATTKLVFGEATWSAPALDSAAQPLAGQPEGVVRLQRRNHTPHLSFTNPYSLVFPKPINMIAFDTRERDITTAQQPHSKPSKKAPLERRPTPNSARLSVVPCK